MSAGGRGLEEGEGVAAVHEFVDDGGVVEGGPLLEAGPLGEGVFGGATCVAEEVAGAAGVVGVGGGWVGQRHGGLQEGHLVVNLESRCGRLGVVMEGG